MMYTIKVTADDIAAGKRCNHRACPVAIALRRYLYDDRITVEATHMTSGEYATITRLPKRVQVFIRAFDQAKPVVPFTFRLPCPLSRI